VKPVSLKKTSNGVVRQFPLAQLATTVRSSPYGESPGELFTPATVVIFHPLMETGVVIPLPEPVMVVAPLLTISIESAAATEATKEASNVHKNNFFI
jgi:hypothetical protein